MLLGFPGTRTLALRQRLIAGDVCAGTSREEIEEMAAAAPPFGAHTFNATSTRGTKVGLTIWAMPPGRDDKDAARYRDLWKNYYQNADVVVLLVEGGAAVSEEAMRHMGLQFAEDEVRRAHRLSVLDVEGCRRGGPNIVESGKRVWPPEVAMVGMSGGKAEAGGGGVFVTSPADRLLVDGDHGEGIKELGTRLADAVEAVRKRERV